MHTIWMWFQGPNGKLLTSLKMMKSKFCGHPVGDKLTQSKHKDVLQIGDLVLNSRVFLGTSRYPSHQCMLDCLSASGTEFVTVSLRRVPPNTQGTENLYTILRSKGYNLLPNTAGCFGAKEAVLTALLTREALQTWRPTRP